MNSLKKIINVVRSKLVEPRVYALVYEHHKSGTSQLYMTLSYSLDEAHSEFFQDFKDKGYDHATGRFTMWISTPVADLVEQQIEQVKNDPQLADKNLLMKRIIDEKNQELFESNREIFSESEIALLSDKLK